MTKGRRAGIKERKYYKKKTALIKKTWLGKLIRSLEPSYRGYESAEERTLTDQLVKQKLQDILQAEFDFSLINSLIFL